MNDQDILKLEYFFPYRLSVLSATITKEIAKTYEEVFELSVPEWRVMAVLGRNPGISANEIAEISAMDKVAVSRAVKNMLENNRLERSFATEDKRRSVLTLSAEGQRIYKRIVPLALAYEKRLLEAVNPQSITTLDQLITDLQKHANELQNMEIEEFSKAS